MDRQTLVGRIQQQLLRRQARRRQIESNQHGGSQKQIQHCDRFCPRKFEFRAVHERRRFLGKSGNQIQQVGCLCRH